MARKKSLSKKKTAVKEPRKYMDVILLESHGIYKDGQKINVPNKIGLKWIEEKKAKSTEQKEKTDTEMVIERKEEENND